MEGSPSITSSLIACELHHIVLRHIGGLRHRPQAMVSCKAVPAAAAFRHCRAQGWHLRQAARKRFLLNASLHHEHEL